MAAAVILNAAEIHGLLYSPSGGVALDLWRRARLVRNGAVRLCPVDTGRLRSSITAVLAIDGGIPYAIIGSAVEYAAYVENGTRYMKGRHFLRNSLPLGMGPP